MKRYENIQSQEVDQKENMNLDEDMLEINEIENLNQDTTDMELLQMKWLALTDNFANQKPVPKKTVAPRSRSLSRKPEKSGNTQQTWTRVQSVDREKMDDDPTLNFIRWPRAEGSVLKRAGSPLTFVPQPLEEPYGNVQIPSGKITPKMKSEKMMDQAPREVLMNLDQNTLA